MAAFSTLIGSQAQTVLQTCPATALRGLTREGSQLSCGLHPSRFPGTDGEGPERSHPPLLGTQRSLPLSGSCLRAPISLVPTSLPFPPESPKKEAQLPLARRRSILVASLRKEALSWVKVGFFSRCFRVSQYSPGWPCDPPASTYLPSAGITHGFIFE